MLKLRTILVLCALLTVCYCQDLLMHHHMYKKKKKHHHHGYHDLFFKGGLFWYFTFLAFKIKTVFIVGTIFSIGLIVGKAFALIKFAEYMKEKEEPKTTHEHHDEKIIFDDPHSAYPGSAYSGPYSGSSGPPTSYNDLESSGSSHSHAYQAFPPGYTVDTPPPNFMTNGNRGKTMAGGHQSFPPGYTVDTPPPGFMTDVNGGNMMGGAGPSNGNRGNAMTGGHQPFPPGYSVDTPPPGFMTDANGKNMMAGAGPSNGNRGNAMTGGHQSFPPGFSVDTPPPGFMRNGNGGNMMSGVGQAYAQPDVQFDQSYGGGQEYPTGQDDYNRMQHRVQGYGGGSGRSQETMGVIYESLQTFARIIKTLNITEIIFKNMGIKTDDCKKKFVCEAEYNAKQSIILRTAFHTLSDESYMKYRPNKTIDSIEECTTVNSGCIDSNENNT